MQLASAYLLFCDKSIIIFPRQNRNCILTFAFKKRQIIHLNLLWALNSVFAMSVFPPKIRGRATIFILEAPIKIAAVVISDILPDGIHRQRSVGKQIRSLLQFALLQQFLEVEAGMPFQETAHRIGRQSDRGGDIRQCAGFVVAFNILQNGKDQRLLPLARVIFIDALRKER